jgi:hypothetical protein
VKYKKLARPHDSERSVLSLAVGCLTFRFWALLDLLIAVMRSKFLSPLDTRQLFTNAPRPGLWSNATEAHRPVALHPARFFRRCGSAPP